MSQFSVSWNSFKSNICNGLSSLQQKGEFVDCTLAADGHFVKVHQMVISLASPYLKELIKSAECPHPVIFLNKISYPTLCCILEYVYSGEVLVNKDNLQELVEAGKALHIKGLEDMSANQPFVRQNDDDKYSKDTNKQVKVTQRPSSLVDSLQKLKSKMNRGPSPERHIVTVEGTSRDFHIEDDKMSDPFTDIGGDSPHHTDNDDVIMDDTGTGSDVVVNLAHSRTVSSLPEGSREVIGSKSLQYTLSNQGSLQLVLNRFVYVLRYVHKRSAPPVRQWRCADYNKNRCSALVYTKDDLVVQRVGAHKHPFHDKKIVKRMQAGIIFSAVKEAEMQGKIGKKKTDHDRSQSDKEES